jgi:hypothetical protein
MREHQLFVQSDYKPYESNSNKSKVLVVRVNRSKQWKLGSDLIEEINEYKYLGVYFSRSLKFNYHINSYVKENADQKLKCHRQTINN